MKARTTSSTTMRTRASVAAAPGGTISFWPPLLAARLRSCRRACSTISSGRHCWLRPRWHAAWRASAHAHTRVATWPRLRCDVPRALPAPPLHTRHWRVCSGGTLRSRPRPARRGAGAVLGPDRRGVTVCSRGAATTLVRAEDTSGVNRTRPTARTLWYARGPRRGAGLGPSSTQQCSCSSTLGLGLARDVTKLTRGPTLTRRDLASPRHAPASTQLGPNRAGAGHAHAKTQKYVRCESARARPTCHDRASGLEPRRLSSSVIPSRATSSRCSLIRRRSVPFVFVRRREPCRLPRRSSTRRR